MNAVKGFGLIAVCTGFALIGSQIVQEFPWQAGIALGVLLILIGGLCLVDVDEYP